MQQREHFPNSGPLYPLPEIVHVTGFSMYLTLLASDSFSITKQEWCYCPVYLRIVEHIKFSNSGESSLDNYKSLSKYDNFFTNKLFSE